MREVLESLLGVDRNNPFFEVLFDPKTSDELQIYYGMRLLEIVPRNSFPEKLLIARLFNGGHNQKSLHKAFNYDIKTMRRWGNLLRVGDFESIQKIGRGPGAMKKLTKERTQYIYYLFNEHYKTQGRHINKFISTEYFKCFNDTITVEALRRFLKEKRDIADNKIIPEQTLTDINRNMKSEDGLYLDKEIRELLENSKNIDTDLEVKNESKIPPKREKCLNGVSKLSMENDEKSKLSPSYVNLNGVNFPIIDNRFKEIFSCHHIGILLSRIFLDLVSESLSDIRDITRQWIAMILSGKQNIEQSKSLNYRDLELLIGNQKSSVNKQRDELKKISNKDNVNLLFRQNIKLVGAEKDNIFLLDPHGVAYTGQLKILKGWLGSSHNIGKAYYLDLIHTLKGEPIFSKIDDNFYDLRQRFYSIVEDFREIFTEDKDRPLTMVVDRAIYGIKFMKEAREKNIFIVTWEKDYKKGTIDSNLKTITKSFFIKKYKNSNEDSYIYTVLYSKKKWHKEETFTQFIIQLFKPGKEPIELSVLCTEQTADPVTVIKAILTRWIQENDIGYLISLGINQITSYSYSSYETIADNLTDREIKNKKLSQLLTQKNKLKIQLGKILVDREFYISKKEDELIKLKSKKIIYEKKILKIADDKNLAKGSMKSLRKELKKIENKIKKNPKEVEKFLEKNTSKQKEIRGNINIINEEGKNIPDKMSRLEFLIQEEYIKLNFMQKSFMDGVKVIARNIIYNLLSIFRPIWNNRRNDLVVLRELLLSIGHIQESEKQIIIQISTARQFSKNEKQKIYLFFFKISDNIQKLYKNEKTILFSLYEN